MFKLFDDDNSGTITFKNLQRVARELGETLTDDELQEMIDEADRDGITFSCVDFFIIFTSGEPGDNAINEDEFFRVMKKRGDNPLDDLSSDED